MGVGRLGGLGELGGGGASPGFSFTLPCCVKGRRSKRGARAD